MASVGLRWRQVMLPLLAALFLAISPPPGLAETPSGSASQTNPSLPDPSHAADVGKSAAENAPVPVPLPPNIPDFAPPPVPDFMLKPQQKPLTMEEMARQAEEAAARARKETPPAPAQKM